MDKGTAWMLWALSWMGVGGLHRFYLGKPWTGLLYLCTYNLAGIGLLVDAFTLNEQVAWANERMGMPQLDAPQMLPALQEPLRNRLLKAAAARRGSLTLSEAAMDTGADFPEVERELDALMHRGVVSVDNHPDSGTVMYRFPELEPRD